MTPGQRRSAVVAIQSAILCLFVWQALVVHYVEDDGFISFRYAQHLAQGLGLVYNVGERVEGYSNFLWVVMLAGASRLLPFVSLPRLAEMAGIGSACLIVLLAFRFPQLVSGHRRIEGLLAGLLLAVHASLVAWSTAGLETTFFALLLFISAVACVRYLQGGQGAWWVAFWFGLVALARADGAIFVVVSLAFVLVVDVARFGRAGVTRSLRVAIGFVAIYLPYLAWRYWYYGDLVPNTAYVKVGGGLLTLTRGLFYVRGYVLDYGVWLWMPAVALYLWRTREVWVWYFVCLIAVHLSYVTYVGGDSLGFYRLLAHIAPLMYVVAAAALVDTYQRYLQPRAMAAVRWAAAGLAIVVIAGFTTRLTLVPVFFPERGRWFEPQSELSFPGNGSDHAYRWFGNYFVDRLSVAARYLQQTAAPNSLVAATPAGAIAYYMDNRVIDMLGLTDTHIARTTDLYRGEEWIYGRAGHEKGDGRYVLSRDPDYILMANVAVLPFPLTEESMADRLVFKSEHELWADPQFHARYELVSVRLAERGPFQYFTFYRKKP